MQETFEKAIKALHTFDQKRSFSTWLLSICRNSFLDGRRREGRCHPSSDLPLELESRGSLEETVLGQISIERLIASLSEGDRLLVELRVFQEMPFAEIAEALGTNESTIRGRFFRLLGRLRSDPGLADAHGERTEE